MRVEHSGSWRAAQIVGEGLLDKGSLARLACSTTADNRSKRDAFEPEPIQPRFNLTTPRPAKNGKQWPHGVSTEITVQLDICANWLLVGLVGKWGLRH